MEQVTELITAFRLVVLSGARQTGNTTLVRELLGLPDRARYSFDDETFVLTEIYKQTAGTWSPVVGPRSQS